MLKAAQRQSVPDSAVGTSRDPLVIEPVIKLESWMAAYVIATQARRRMAFLDQTIAHRWLAFDDYDDARLRGQMAVDWAEVLDRRMRGGRTTLLAGRSLPGRLAIDSSRLRDRLRGATVCELRPLSDQSVRQVLTRELTRQQIPTTAVACEMLVPTLPRQIGPLRESIGELLQTVRRTGGELSHRLAASVVRSRPIAGQEPGQAATLSDCERAAAREFGLTSRNLRSRRRDAAVATARQVAMWLSRQLSGESWATIGRHFGGRQHSTVLHAHKRIETEVATGSDLGITAGRLRDDLANRIRASQTRS